MRSAWFSREDVEQMIRSGVIADAQSIAAYGLFCCAGDEVRTQTTDDATDRGSGWCLN